MGTAKINFAALPVSDVCQDLHIQTVTRPLPHQMFLRFAQPRAGFQNQTSFLSHNTNALKHNLHTGGNFSVSQSCSQEREYFRTGKQRSQNRVQFIERLILPFLTFTSDSTSQSNPLSWLNCITNSRKESGTTMT